MRVPVVLMIDEVSDGVGGAERFAVALACGLPADRFAVTLCVTRTAEPSGLLDELRAADVTVLELRRSGTRDIAALRPLGRYLREHGVQVLHCHKFGSNLWGTLVGRLAGVPVVLAHEHTWSYEGQPVRKFLDGHVIGRLCTRFVAVSDLDRRRMTEIEGVPARKTLTVPTAYLPRAGDGAARDLRDELGLAAGTPLVGTLAALRPQKRLEDLIAAFQIVLERVPEAHLVIGGDGPERGRLEELARADAVRGRVHLLGVREDLATLMTSFDVAAMSSTFEGMPLFVFEAMTYGTPLVTTDVGGIPDVIRDGVEGRLVSVGEPQRLGAVIAELLESPAERERLAAAAQERATEFTIERAVTRFADLYLELLER